MPYLGVGQVRSGADVLCASFGSAWKQGGKRSPLDGEGGSGCSCVIAPLGNENYHNSIARMGMTDYERCEEDLRARPRRWLVTGAAGFIGSNLVERLLVLGQEVVGLDDFSTGHRHNVESLREFAVRTTGRLRFVEGDVTDTASCATAFDGIDIVLHQAALGSVPRSIADPIATNHANVTGFLNMLVAARDAGVRRVVYAASSSTYGDHPGLPKVEDCIGRPLSPYAVTKLVNELYAEVFARTYGLGSIGLRYFNVFGRRQDPAGAYAAVIPRWVASLLTGSACRINGDGETSRDFCYIDNVLQANLLAATVDDEAAVNQVYNVACGQRTTLNDLFRTIRDGLAVHRPWLAAVEPAYGPFRPGDVRHSLADITKAQTLLGYAPTHSPQAGLAEALRWYVETADIRDGGAPLTSASPARRFRETTP